MSKSDLHEDLVDVVRFDARNLLWKRGYSDDAMSCMVGDGGLPPSWFVSGKNPPRADVWMINRLKDAFQVIAIEVGQVKASKWHGIYTMIHVTYQHNVGIYDAQGTVFETAVVTAIKDALAACPIVPKA